MMITLYWYQELKILMNLPASRKLDFTESRRGYSGDWYQFVSEVWYEIYHNNLFIASMHLLIASLFCRSTTVQSKHFLPRNLSANLSPDMSAPVCKVFNIRAYSFSATNNHQIPCMLDMVTFGSIVFRKLLFHQRRMNLRNTLVWNFKSHNALKHCKMKLFLLKEGVAIFFFPCVSDGIGSTTLPSPYLMLLVAIL